MKWRRNLSGSLFLAATLVLAACGPNTGDPQETAAEPEAGTDSAEGSPAATGDTGTGDIGGEIFVYGASYETADEIATTRVDHFTEQYPNVDVQFSESGFNPQELLTALQASEPPDVIRMPRNFIGSYIQRGVFEPLDSCLEQMGVETSLYREAAIDQLTVDGQLYALPEAYWIRAWLIDNVVFEEAGLNPDEFDFSDWDAIREANTTILEASETALIGIDPQVSDPTSAAQFPMWVRANGGRLIADDGTPQLDSPEAVEALEFVNSIIQSYGSHAEFLDTRGATGDFFGAENPFALHTEGAFPMQQWYINVLASASPDIDITVRPFVGRDGEPITWADGDALGISANSDNKDAACAYITSVLSTEAWVAAAEARAEMRAEEGVPNVGTVTGNVEADEIIFSEIVDLSDYPMWEEAVQTYISVLDSAFALPQSPAAEEVQQAWASAVDSVLSGGADPQEALEQAQREAEAAVEESSN